MCEFHRDKFKFQINLFPNTAVELKFSRNTEIVSNTNQQPSFFY